MSSLNRVNKDKIANVGKEMFEIIERLKSRLTLKELYKKILLSFKTNDKLYIANINNLLDSYIKYTLHVTKIDDYVLSTFVNRKWTLATWEDKYKLINVTNNIYYIRFEDDNCLFCEKVDDQLHFLPTHKPIFFAEIKKTVEKNDKYIDIIKKKINNIVIRCDELHKELRQNEENLIERQKQDIQKIDEKIEKIEAKKKDLRDKIIEINKNLKIQEINLEKNREEKKKIENIILLKKANVENIYVIFENMIKNANIFT